MLKWMATHAPVYIFFLHLHPVLWGVISTVLRVSVCGIICGKSAHSGGFYFVRVISGFINIYFYIFRVVFVSATAGAGRQNSRLQRAQLRRQKKMVRGMWTFVGPFPHGNLVRVWRLAIWQLMRQTPVFIEATHDCMPGCEREGANRCEFFHEWRSYLDAKNSEGQFCLSMSFPRRGSFIYDLWRTAVMTK